MGVISTGSHPKALWPGVKAWFGRAYDEHQPKYVDLFKIDTSNKAYEELVELTGFGLAPEKAQGASTVFDSESQGFVNRLTNVAYSIGYICTYEENADGQYEVVSKRRAQAVAFSMRQTKEIVGANIYNRGFSGSYTFGDGVSLLSDSHPTVNGTQSNILATAADFSESSLEDLCVQIMNAKNSRGLAINLTPEVLIIPTALSFEAARVLQSVNQSGGANNDINAIRSMGLIPKVSVNPYLSDSDAWFVRTNAPSGMTCFEREAMSFEQDNDFDTKNLKAIAYERYSFGFGDWRGLYGTAGA